MPERPIFYSKIEELASFVDVTANFMPYNPDDTHDVNKTKIYIVNLKSDLDTYLFEQSDELKRYVWRIYDKCLQNYSKWVIANDIHQKNGYIDEQ